MDTDENYTTIPFEQLFNVSILERTLDGSRWAILSITKKNVYIENIETGERDLPQVPLDTREFRIDEFNQ